MTAEGNSKMGYGGIWKILDDLVIEFRKKGESIPQNVMEDLRSAKTMIQVLKADPARAENIPSIEMYLGNVESYLIFKGHEKFGAEFADKWTEKLREARQTVRQGALEETWEPASRFVVGVPRGEKWVRVQVSAEIPRSEIKKLAAEAGLSTRMQADGYMLVHGEEEKLKAFVHKIGEKIRSKKQS